MRKLYVLIPVLNEAENIPRLIDGISKWKLELTDIDFQFIFINDGSTDQTKNLLEKFSSSHPIHVLNHTERSGPGMAFATGFTHLSKIVQKHDLVVTMEGDNTSRPNILKIMLGRVDREDAEIVLASPYAYGGGMSNTSLFRVILSHIANGLMKIVLKFNGINTFSSFYRMYTGDAILRLQKTYGAGIIESSGFECMVELLYKILQSKFSLSEVPMQLDTSLRAGKSKMRVMRTIRGYLKIMRIKNKWNQTEPS